MRFTIGKKIALLLLMMTVIATINLAVVYEFLSTQRYDSHIINIAGRQRMLSQKIAKLALTIAHDNDKLFEIKDSDREDLLKAVEFYDTSLNALQNGGKVLGRVIPKAPTSIDEVFKKNRDVWLPIKKSVDIALKEQQYNIIFNESVENIRLNSDNLLNVSNEVTSSFEQIFSRKVNLLKRILIAMLALDVLIIISGWKLADVYIVRPIKLLTKTAGKIGRGDFQQEILIPKTSDEIGELASTFKSMLSDLQTTTVSKDYVDNIISSMLNSLIIINMDGTIRQINQAAVNLLGYSEEELIGIPFADILHGGQSLVDDLLNDTKQIKENIYLTKTKKEIPVAFSNSIMLDGNGNKNAIVCVAQDITELKQATETIKNDLKAASIMQRKLLPDPAEISGFKFNWIFRPSSYLGGDMFNYFKLDEENIGFYLLDVTGHGLPAALLSFNLSKTLSPFPIELSPLKRTIPEPPYHQTLTPALAVEEINKRFQRQAGTMQYFTMVYAVINLKTNILNILRAGHAMPIFLPKDGVSVLIEKGGLPVGMLPDIKFDKDLEQIPLNQGDRLFIYSDGVTDCVNNENQQFSEKRLIEFIEGNRHSPLEKLNRDLEQALLIWRGDAEFIDDVSMLSIERLTL